MTDSLKAYNLEQCFGDTQLWRIDQLTLSPGRVIHLRGENGSGKTTLLKVLSGLQKPSKGQVLFNNQPVKPGHKVCYLHQQPYMFDRSVRRNLELVLQSRSDKRVEKKKTLQEVLFWSGLSMQADQPARTLSGGERQALAMARAKLCNPSFWLLDEPTSNLDEKGIRRCVELVSTLQATGASIILTTHQTGLLTELCDQTWWLKQGALITHE